jgi:glycosyltransferase involved in cell wall biosynthesis
VVRGPARRVRALRLASFLQRLPGLHRRYRYALPLFPFAIEGLRPDGFDLVLSSSHCVAKAVRTPPSTMHVCYCHTPMRYVWDEYDAYFGRDRAAWPVRAAMRVLAPALRHWDRRTTGRVDAFIANSAFVRGRIRRLYGRDATVVHPPVNIERFAPARHRTETYLIVSALVAYKRIDRAIAAFNALNRPLAIAGDGPERGRLQRMAGRHITFLGRVSDREVARLMARCRAFIIPGVEDFGITPVEAQAAGAPVIALAAGGARETVIDRGPPGTTTGVLFDEPSPAALARAIRRFETMAFDPAVLRRNAARFSAARFRAGLAAEIDRAIGRG